MKYDAIANRVNQASGKETKSSHKTASGDIHALVLDTVAWYTSGRYQQPNSSQLAL